MKKISHVKNKALISMLLIITGVFTACGKADRADIEKDLSENVTSGAATNSDAVFLDEDIPEKLTYTVNGAQGTIKVNADVYAEGYGTVSTYNLKRCEKNDEWLAGYAKKFFDDGEYENVKPYRFCSLDELRQEKSFCEELLSQYEPQTPAYNIILLELSDIEMQIENYVETEYVKYPDDRLIYEFDTDITLQSGKVLSCDQAHLKGKADEKLWYMNYERGCYDNLGVLSEEQREVVGTYGEQTGMLYGFCPENTPDIMYMMDMDIGFPNKCERETAETEAEKLLERLGLENMKQVYITPLRVDTDENDDDNSMLDGYILTYAPSVNGVDILYGTSAECIGVDDSGIETVPNILTEQPFVKIGVSSAGIFQFCIYDQYEIGDTMAGSSSMLGFAQIDSQVKNTFEAMVENNKLDVEIDEVRFGYVCVTYDGISYAMVPAWRYYENMSVGNTKWPFLTVCALDGSYFYTWSGSYNPLLWID